MVLPSIEELALQKRKPVFTNGVGIYNYVRNTSNILQCTKVYFGLFLNKSIINLIITDKLRDIHTCTLFIRQVFNMVSYKTIAL